MAPMQGYLFLFEKIWSAAGHFAKRMIICGANNEQCEWFNEVPHRSLRMKSGVAFGLPPHSRSNKVPALMKVQEDGAWQAR